MNELSATDEWDEGKLNKHSALNIRHAQLTRERDSVRAQRERYEATKPATREAQQGPIARWVRGGAERARRRGNRGSSPRRRRLALGADRRAPATSMIIRAPQAATASDATSGQEAVEEEIPPRIIDTLTYYGGVARMVQHIMTGTGGPLSHDADGRRCSGG